MIVAGFVQVEKKEIPGFLRNFKLPMENFSMPSFRVLKPILYVKVLKKCLLILRTYIQFIKTKRREKGDRVEEKEAKDDRSQT